MPTSLSTLQTWLDQALEARHKLAIGEKVVTAGSPKGSVTFTAADADRLDAWISRLQSWIANGGIPETSAGSSYRPVRFLF